jgi:predicted secreted protein
MRARLFLALLLLPAAAPADEPLFNLVTLSAQAEREVPNDLLTAVLAAAADGADPAQLADSVNRTMQRALALAKAARDVQVRSGGYQSSPLYEHNRIVRWRVRQELRLESHDIAAATGLIGKLQSILTLAGLSLSVSPELRRKTENALIGEALAAFKERAGLVAGAMAEKSYRMRSLQISGGGPFPRPIPMLAGKAAPGSFSPSAPALETGTSRVLVTVSGTIQLQ